MREPKPIALFFRLGKNANYGGKRLPASLAKAPCWVYREDFNDRCKATDALPDPPIPKKDEEAMFEVMDGFLDEMDLFGELCSDVEMQDDDFEIRPSLCFRGGTITAKAVRAALEKDGFRVITIVDPLATPKIEQSEEELIASGLESLDQSLDLASLELVKECLAKGEDLPRHAEAACSQLWYSHTRNADRLLKHLQTAMPTWPQDVQELVRVLIEHGAKEKERTNAMKALLEKLPHSEL